MLVGREVVAETMSGDALPESLAPLFRPDGIAVAIESKMAESFGQEEFGSHLSCLAVVAGDVGDICEPLLVVLCQGDDAVLPEQVHVVIIAELADDGIRLPGLGPFQHSFHAVCCLEGRGHAAHDPRLVVLGVCQDSFQQVVGKPFGEIGEENQSDHGFSLMAWDYVCKSRIKFRHFLMMAAISFFRAIVG